MSELAFDLDGEPFAFSRKTHKLRVRRFRNPGLRGAPEVVHDPQGGQLYVPAACTYLEFRKLVGSLPGRYRLDQCDEAGAVIEDEPPAYVTISEARNAGHGDGADALAVIRDMAAINTDALKALAQGYASCMSATAEILRAADGAGLPRREPRKAEREESEDGVVYVVDDQDDDDDEREPSASEKLWNLVEPIAPMVKEALPALAAWLVAQFMRTQGAAAAAAGPAASDAPSGGAASTGGDTAGGATARPGAAPRRAPPPPPPPEPAPSDLDGSDDGDDDGGGGDSGGGGGAPNGGGASTAAPAEAATSASTPSAADGVRNAAPDPTAAQWAHLLAIYARLEPREAAVAKLAVKRMTPAMRAQWLADLSRLGVEDAVTVVRHVLREAESRPPREGA
jgi:hypothetical protein